MVQQQQPLPPQPIKSSLDSLLTVSAVTSSSCGGGKVSIFGGRSNNNVLQPLGSKFNSLYGRQSSFPDLCAADADEGAADLFLGLDEGISFVHEDLDPFQLIA